MSGSEIRARRRRWQSTIAAAAALAVGVTGLPSAAMAAPGAEVPQSSLGYPEFKGVEDPVPETGVTYSPESSYLGKVFAKDVADGAGTSVEKDFWVDKMLARTGPMFDGTENQVAFTRGRAAFMKTHTPGKLGWAGEVAYWENLGKGDGFTITVEVDGKPVTLKEDTAQRKQTPSYYHSVFTGDGLTVVQDKFITEQNVLVTNLSVSGTTGEVQVVVSSPHVTTADGAELTGRESALNNVTTLFPRLSGDGFEVVDGKLARTLSVPASGAATTKVQLGLITEEIPESAVEYEAIAGQTPQAAFTSHVTAYNKWWADNLVYLDTPEDNIDKTLFYRWWLMRYNFLDANVPGNDFQFPTTMEGVLGYNNSIVLTVGMFIDDLKYFRDPIYSYGSALSVGESSKSTRFIDNPGNPAHWSNSYTQYVTEAAWRAYQIHGGPGQLGAPLAKHSESDVKGLLKDFDFNKNGLIEYSWGAMTGNDADAVSFDWARGNMDRTENAYLYSNSKAAANFYEAAGDTAGAERMNDQAQSVRSAVLEHLWEDERATPDEVGLEGNLLKHKMANGDLNPWKEINNYYPFSVGLMPKEGDADYDAKYVEALRLFADSDQYPVFPFFTANQVDKAAAAEKGFVGSNNFSIINSTVWFRLLSSTLRDYQTDYITPEMYKQLLYWNAYAHYQDGDNRLPNQNEFWADGSAKDGGKIGYRSWIHHTILGTTNFTMIEDTMGLRPREDNLIELDPIDIGWNFFTANNVRYHGSDLSVVWDKDGTEYGGPAGYSLYVDGEKAFTVDQLTKVVYNPATGEVELPVGSSAKVVTSETAGFKASNEVAFADNSRVVDIFAKAGTDISQASGSAKNLAQGKSVTASFEAKDRPAAAAVNGSTVNEPFWGTAGSPNSVDSFEVDLGGAQAVDDVRVFFYRTSSTATAQGYAAPQLYTIDYWTGTDWTPVPQQARTPVYATANLNQSQFPKVTTSKIRVNVNHAAGAATGIKEVQVFNTGVTAPVATNAAPKVTVSQDKTITSPNSARLVGSVSDDGLPAGTLTTKWTVKSAPQGANVVIADEDKPVTTVRFTAEGKYVLTLTASDGELSTSADFTVENKHGSDAKQNIALQATASASAVTGWNVVSAMNDGKAPYPVGGEADAWATWGQKPDANNAFQATLTWDEPQRIEETAILFHNDNGGVRPPSEWSLEYRDAEGAWHPVTNPSEYGTTVAIFNTTSFDAVKTDALRASLVKRGDSFPGIIEWRVFPEEPVSVAPTAVRTMVGQAPVLPDTVDVVYKNGEMVETPVVWQLIEEDKYAAESTFEVTGFIDGISLLAKATVSVRLVDAVQINTYEPIDVTTKAGSKPFLPRNVLATYNDGSTATVSVTWDEIDPESYAAPGTFAVEGTVADTDKRPVVTVTVTAGDLAAPTVTLETDPVVASDQWLNEPVTVTVTAADAVDDAPVIEIQLDGTWAPYTAPVVIDAEGESTVRARVTTSDGRKSAVAAQTIAIDRVAPQVTATFDEDRRVLSVTAVDSSSGVETTEYRVGSGDWTAYEGAVVVEVAGEITYRATDAVGNVSEEGSLSVGKPTDQYRPNIAPDATATVSKTTSWNSAKGLNDRVDTVPVTDDSKAWGTWGLTDKTQWAQLTWDEPVTVDRSAIRFFDDGQEMAAPESWTLEYLDGAGQWVTVPNPSGFTTSTDAYDVITHSAVTTTALRATLTKPASGFVGIVEWEVNAVEAKEATLTVPTGTVLAGSAFAVGISDAAAGDTFTVTLEPGAVALGTITVGSDGSGTAQVTVPAGLATGAYTVRAAFGDTVLEAFLDVKAVTEPGTEEPGTEEPGGEKPGTDEPGTEEPGGEKPGTDEPGSEKPGSQNPGAGNTDGADDTDTTTGKDTNDGLPVTGASVMGALLLAMLLAAGGLFAVRMRKKNSLS